MSKRAVILLLVFVMGIALTSQAGTTELVLSTHSSTSPSVGPELLDALLEFSVEDSTLTLSVTNLTPESVSDPQLKMNQVYFNATDNITGLTLTEVIDPIEGSVLNQWNKDSGFSEDGYQVDSFGLFDVALIDGQGNQPHVIDPNETLVFTFDITGSGTYMATDFTTELSTQVDEHVISYAAAKFYNGDDISSYGATNVPEPATMCVFGLGGLVFLRKRK